MEIISKLRGGPKTAEELARILRTSKKSLYKNIYKLVDSGEVVTYPLQDGHRWKTLFALHGHSDLASAICGYTKVKRVGKEKEIVKAIDVLRKKLLRNPEVDEILIEVGESPEDRLMRDEVYKVGTKIKWKPPTKSERKVAEEELSRILTLATWIKRGRIPEALARGMSKAEIARARKYLQQFPEMLS
jgi:DNA-binding Lrp family transcriptional regulator